MSKKFIAILTQAGSEKIADAVIAGEKLVFTQMAVGDGGGDATTPNAAQTALVNETFRTSLNSLRIANSDKNTIAAEMIIPPEAGGFSIREAALFDDGGTCIAVASVPETYKPLLDEGSGRFTIIRIWLTVSSTEHIELLVDPSVVLATVEDVISVGSEGKDYTDKQLSEHAESRNHPDATLNEKGFTQLSNALDSTDESKAATPAAIKAAIAHAIRSAWELDNPVGTVKFYAQNVNPNERYPWSEWVYTGENKTIRVGKADGSDVATTGGSDSVTIERANLPAVQIDVSGETSEQPEQTLTTAENGAHNHQGGDGAPGEQWREGTHGTDNQKDANFNLTSDAPAHSHDVVIPPHKHSTTGKTANLGEGKSFSVVEAHTLLMCWARVA
ncbi:phage tail protein [Klebsiella pneumoniae]|uniref:phage tail protein n=1 Tax=Klebsiella TaxID=570 RepID=UPI000BA10FF7|nr:MULTISPECIES: phage tail protein [Klebsiella]MCJ3258313.1 phage tail protein [Klebsiella pneumoniae]MCJ3267225.1 phage tail protein [Klebsiella pneumoniae]MCJ3274614.1 phage tail protein [Klebsiella pneumoniae]OZQ49819.1 phage tail protein [Klebsiella pneumoniae]OZR14451.1 phage tail protein [Klebsiella pneumoniae]